MNEAYIEQTQSSTDVSDSEALGLSSGERHEKVDQGEKEPESSSKVCRHDLDVIIMMILYSTELHELCRMDQPELLGMSSGSTAPKDLGS